MGDSTENCAHRASPRPADGDAKDAGRGFAQQLRPYGRYRRAHAESCAHNLRLCEPERTIRWRSGGRREDITSWCRRQSRDRTPRQEIDLRNGAGSSYSGFVNTPQTIRSGAPAPVPPLPLLKTELASLQRVTCGAMVPAWAVLSAATISAKSCRVTADVRTGKDFYGVSGCAVRGGR